ncbi:protein of unknown function [Candidatus Filomicrobium marinum]|uniref:Uncharacterized protein n=1 Tax=Candidatus Filomicrobium marinum TaxID=1608628 RepID=A0A0D6JJV6_9HYPH|nr:protein of unknown function [Candidatus Filomicrobium marinum]CPR22258.1 protein of unknown function [Candidatus Filomicrobium marinum]
MMLLCRVATLLRLSVAGRKRPWSANSIILLKIEVVAIAGVRLSSLMRSRSEACLRGWGETDKRFG